MDPDFGIDLDELTRMIESTAVFVIRFHVIAQRLLVDARTDNGQPPFIRMVPPVYSAEERYRYLREERPGLPLPEHITIAAWPRYVQVMRDVGLWDRLQERMVSLGGTGMIADCDRAFADIQQAERDEVAAAILGGEGYESLWERAPSR